MAFSHGTPNSIVTDGLVFCVDPANISSYPRTGATVTDIVGDTTGTLSGEGGGNNTPQWENTNGGIFDFDGTDDHIELSPSTLSITGALTISAWVKTVSSTYQSILIKGDSVSSADYYFRIQDSGKIRFRIGNANYGIGVTSVKDGNWHNVCVVYSPSTSVTYYVDGEQDAQTTSSIPSSITNEYTNVGISEKQYFVGNIAPVQVYNKALSAAKVLQNYNALKNRFRT